MGVDRSLEPYFFVIGMEYRTYRTCNHVPSDAGRAFVNGRRKRLPFYWQLRAPLATLDPKLQAD